MIADYTSYRKVLTPEEVRVFRNWELDPHTPNCLDTLYDFLRLIGEDVEEYVEYFKSKEDEFDFK